MPSKKFQFAQMVMNYCTAVAQNADHGINARTVYNDRGYPPSGSNPITDGDVSGLEITAAMLELAMQFFENFEKMLDNQSITTADYDSTLNNMRNDL